MKSVKGRGGVELERVDDLFRRENSFLEKLPS